MTPAEAINNRLGHLNRNLIVVSDSFISNYKYINAALSRGKLDLLLKHFKLRVK